jgi:hypothetical protein
MLSLTPWPILSALIWIVVALVLLYFARRPVHNLLHSLSWFLYRALRLAARSMTRAEIRLNARNREVLLEAGREASERLVEREFDRVEANVQRDLAAYPDLHRRMSEAITKIEDDHNRSTEEPPTPPGWTEAIESVARVPAKGDPMVAKVLESIHKSMIKTQRRALRAYRRANLVRHWLLRRMRPQWRRLNKLLTQADHDVNRLLDRANSIDERMAEYESVTRGSDRAVRMLSSSSLSQFFISGLVLAIAIGGAVINFHLIARPMSEMVGGTSTIGAFRTADIAALVIILVEISMGLFLMESLRITRLFPVIGALSDPQRIRMAWTTFIILLTLASVESGLAYMREMLLQDQMATSAMLRGEEGAVATEAGFRWITTAAQMGMGFILPFALIFVAIPLESFIHALRSLLGMLATAALRVGAFVLRWVGSLALYAGRGLMDLYDLIIFLPLWIEERIVAWRHPGTPPAVESSPARPGTATKPATASPQKEDNE